MTQASTNVTFKQTAYTNTTGVDSIVQQGSIAYLTADPTAPELLTLAPITWVNTTTQIMKFCTNGTTVKTVTST